MSRHDLQTPRPHDARRTTHYPQTRFFNAGDGGHEELAEGYSILGGTMKYFSCQKGMGLISILLALLIIGLLFVGYLSYKPAAGSSKAAILTARDTASDTTCQMNRLALEKAIFTWSLQHPNEKPTIRALKDSGVPVSDCPQRGQLSIRDGKVLCSKHE